MAMANREPRVAMANREPRVAMADREPRVAMADREPRAAMANPGTRTAMADRVYGPPKKIFLGGSPAGEYPVRASGAKGELDGTSGDEGELGGASGDEGKLDETNSRGCSESADSLGRWRGAGIGGRSGRAELDGSSAEKGELNRISEGIGELDGTSGGIGELNGTSGGIGELDGISGSISIIAGGSRLMIPGHPSRGTKISRRLILGGLFCHESVQRLYGGARNTERGDEELLSNF